MASLPALSPQRHTAGANLHDARTALRERAVRASLVGVPQRLQVSSQQEAGLLVGPLCSPRQSRYSRQPVAALPAARPLEARVDMGASQIFMHEIHRGAPVRQVGGGHNSVFR